MSHPREALLFRLVGQSWNERLRDRVVELVDWEDNEKWGEGVRIELRTLDSFYWSKIRGRHTVSQSLRTFAMSTLPLTPAACEWHDEAAVRALWNSMPKVSQ